jgi:outer membrane protein assembly factor BamB
VRTHRDNVGQHRAYGVKLRPRLLLALVVPLVTFTGCDWFQYRWGPDHNGYNPVESAISVSNVGTLTQLWTGATGGRVESSPAVVNGVVYVGSDDDKLYAFDAKGNTNCSGSPKACSPLWTATTGSYIESSPSVTDGDVFVGSYDGNLYAFDAAGNINCSGTPKTCTPLWTAHTGAAILSSPAISGGVVYVGSDNGKLYAFDAAGNQNCSGTPKVCAPLWTSSYLGGSVYSSPAVANGSVFVGSGNDDLYAFDAAGNINCTGSPKTCSPLWSAVTTGVGISSSPAVAGGVVYITSGDGTFYAFDAAGSINCSGSPKSCLPLWNSNLLDDGTTSSPAVAYGNVYFGQGGGGKLDAFDAAGNTDCSGSPKICSPVWSYEVGTTVNSSPAIANGLVFIGNAINALFAFDAKGQTDCSGTPTTCLPLWTATLGGAVNSSPAIANGVVYVGSDDGKLYAYGLP